MSGLVAYTWGTEKLMIGPALPNSVNSAVDLE